MKISGNFAPDGNTTDVGLEVELWRGELRDLFAAFALAGLLANGVPVAGSDIGEVAYKAADAVLTERGKK